MSSTSPRPGLSKTLQSAKTRIIAGLAFLLLTAVISASALAASNDQSYVGQIAANVSSFLGLSTGSQTSDGMSGVLPQPTPPLEVKEGPPDSDGRADVQISPQGVVMVSQPEESCAPTNSQLITGDTTQTARTLRDGNPSTCAGKGYPGDINPASSYRYKVHTFTNNSNSTCVTASLDSAGGVNQIFDVA